jgi:Thermopsin
MLPCRMHVRGLPSNVLWLVPIVVAIAALMLLPGGSVVPNVVASEEPAPGSTTGAASAASLPLTASAPSPTATVLASLPANLESVPWIASLDHQGPARQPLTSLPNLALLEHSGALGSPVNPFYVAQPAPLGLADYGLGATPYSYNTSHFMGEVTFNAPPNVTDPASTGVIEPGGAADGYVGSVHEFGIQLNTVATKFALPGTDAGFFWTQNVLNWNDTGIHFVDDTFNLTSATQTPFYIAPGTILSGCNNNSAGVNVILYNYGGVFQCVGKTIPVSASSYPVTVQLYNNATTNAQNDSQLSYGYRIVEAGTGKVYTGVSDRLVFNNPNAASGKPKHTPGFSVDGFAGAPPGLFRDAELVLVGDIGGDNSVFRSISGSLSLEYSNASHGGFQSVPSAYNFGGDTGETSTGIADYWTPSHTLEINQGPSMLYGLWNAAPWASVKSGDIHLAGSISPSYGFVFVGNTPSPIDPWATGARDNLSWLPTTNSGTFSTYLPPLGAPWTTKYYVQAFAAGYAEKNGTPVTGSTASYSLTLKAAPGTLEAPLYMYSNAQAAALAKAVTGSGASPYVFNGLVVNMNASFDHLNDYGYASFVVFQAQSVTKPVYVNNTYQGDDSPAGNFYFYDYSFSGSSGLLTPGPNVSGSMPYYTSGINLFDGAGDQVTNQLLAGYYYGLEIVLWQDSHASVSSVTSELLGSGVWVGDSVDTTVSNVVVTSGADGVTDIGSTGTHVNGVLANGTLGGFDRSTGVDAYSSSDGTYTDITATHGGFAVELGEDYGAEADYDPYYYLPGTVGATVSDITAAWGSWGVNASLSTDTSISQLIATHGSVAVFFEDSSYATVAHVFDGDHSTGVWALDASYLTIEWVTARNYSTGAYLDSVTSVTLNNIVASDPSVAVVIV